MAGKRSVLASVGSSAARREGLSTPDHYSQMSTRASISSVVNRPILLIDVDGVISLFGFDHAAPPAGRYQLVDGIAHYLSGTAGHYLRQLRTAYELAWCTGWEEKANDYLPLALGLDGPLPHVEFEPDGRPADAHWKLGGIDRHVDPSRPVAWIDDAHDDALPVLGHRPLRTDAARDHRPGHRDHRAGGGRAPSLGPRPRERGYTLAVTENTGGRRVAAVNQLPPASPEPNTSPDVAPK